jgi:7TMR-DISM extracellular 2
MFAAIPKFLSFRILLTAAWFAALLLTAVGPAAAAPAPSPGPAPVLAPMAPAYDLAPYMEILFDPSQELTIQQVSSHDFDSRFRRTSPRPTLKLGITASAVWLRFKLHRPHTPPAKGLPPRPGGRFIEMDNTQIQFLDAYFPLAMAVGRRASGQYSLGLL